MDEAIIAQLKQIIIKHTVVGGYPNTRKIAEEAFALGAGQISASRQENQITRVDSQ